MALKIGLSPTQTTAFQAARSKTPVAQMLFVSQVPLAWQSQGKESMVDRLSSRQIPEEPF